MIRVFSQYVSVKCIGLMLWDALLVIVCLIAAVKIRFFESPAEFAAHTMLPDFAAQVLVAVMSYMVCFYFNEMYDPHVIRAPEKHPYRLCESLGAACILLGLLYFLIPTVLISRGVFLISLTLLATAISLSRATFRMVWLESASRRPVLILGTGPLAMTVAREMTTRDDLNFEVAGLVSTSNTKSDILPASLFGHPILGSSDSLAGIAARHRITRIVVACEDRRNSLPVLALMSLRVRGVIVEEAHAALAALTGRVWLDIVRPSWFVYSGGFRRSRLHAIVKRMVDIAAGLLGLLLA
ncbi:MAG TPA: hypothetical protein VM120_11730, partial [Bryobacteraceae bacterium]|nr:hypothetical protein [Bryobacteraceae bacterium]